MSEMRSMPRTALLTLILSIPDAKKCIAIARKEGAQNMLVMRGKGTVSSRHLHLFGITSQDRAIVNILMENTAAEALLDTLTDQLHLHKPNHGIAYMAQVSTMGKCPAAQEEGKSKGEDNAMFKKLTIVVNLGMADDIMDIARAAGARGGTILHGRGTGAAYTEKLFGIAIEPEKEWIVILVPTALADRVIAALEEAHDFESPGNGILFVEDVSDVRGVVVE